MNNEIRRRERKNLSVHNLQRNTLIIAGTEVVFSFIVGYYAQASLKGNLGTAVQWGISFFGPLVALNFIFTQFNLNILLQREIRSLVEEELALFRGILTVFDAYFQIQNPEFSSFRDDLISQTIDRLQSLTRGEAEVSGDSYYRWLKDKLLKTQYTVKAVSSRPLSVYRDDPREENFIKQNREAAHRGIRFTRIFILDTEDIIVKSQREILKRHCLKESFTIFIVWRSNVAPSTLQETEGGGFSIYDDSVVFFDRSYFHQNLSDSHSGPLVPRASIYTKVHKSSRRYKEIYDELENLVQVSLKVSSEHVYRNVLLYLDKCLTDKYQTTSPDNVRNQSPLSAAIETELNEWRKIQQEISDTNSLQFKCSQI
jgi:hypothetical protein